MARKARVEENENGDYDIIGAPVGGNTEGPASGELLQFIERFEQLDSERKDVVAQQSDLMKEAKGRGYDTKAMRVIIKERAANRDDLQEFQSVLELYRAALGMD